VAGAPAGGAASDAGSVLVIDIGKSFAKVSRADAAGRILDTRSAPNRVLPGPPWPHHDLRGLSDWVFGALAELARGGGGGAERVIATGHGSGGVLVGKDPDAEGTGAALPMIDYEAESPPAVDAAYARLAGGFPERGSAIMLRSAHQARQMLRAAMEAPAAFARAAHALAVAPYWAWRLSGVAASEVTSLGAQSHLWDVAGRRWAPIVAACGWQRLLPPMRPGWDDLGPLRPELARRHGLPGGLRVHLGAHDSSTAFYRYQAGGFRGFTLVSTGTWIVALSDSCPPERLDAARGMTLNADMTGAPVGGCLAMGGREFALIAGPAGLAAAAGPEDVAAVVRAGTVAVPSFSADSGLFPGSAGRGRIEGPAPATPQGLRALALLHGAMLTEACAAALGGAGPLILDGAFLADPLFAPLVAALVPERRVLASDEPHGVTAGAALLAHHAGRTRPAELVLRPVAPARVPGLADWAELWRSRARAGGNAE